MSAVQSLLSEFKQEAATTRRLLERVPEDRTSWKPHPKSLSIGELSLHVASLLSWGSTTLRDREFDMNPPEGERWTPPAFESMDETLDTFDRNVRDVQGALAGATDEQLMQSWTLKNSGQTVFTLPRGVVLRSFIMNHLVHHRGQLTVYLRLCDVPLPSIYGPSADEQG